MFDGWSFAPWLRELCKIGLIILVVIIIVLVAVPCILQCVQKMTSKTMSNILIVHREGGDVGEDETGKPWKYDCPTKDFGNMKTTGNIEMKATFEIPSLSY